MSKVNVKIVGHELREERAKQPDGSVVTYDMLHVKMRGIGEDKKTRITLVVDPDARVMFPLADLGEISFEIRQTRLDLAEAN